MENEQPENKKVKSTTNELLSKLINTTGPLSSAQSLDPSAIQNLHYRPTYNHINIRTERSLNSILADHKTFKLELETTNLRTKINQLEKSLEKYKDDTIQYKETIDEIIKTNAVLGKKLKLGYLLSQVNESAKQKLFESSAFLDCFSKTHPSFVLSIDIRRSTELMLKAKEPELFERFIVQLCNKLTNVILANYGVFDKFTGDGILAFFPTFFSGKDAGLLAIKSAIECHTVFEDHYKANRSCFVSVLKDIGLGIGIDSGSAYLVNMNNAYTVIGTPVVYACRLSGAPAGCTLLNQTSFDEVFEKYRQYFNFSETSINIKNEGETIAYNVSMNGSALKIEVPDWQEIPDDCDIDKESVEEDMDINNEIASELDE